MQENNEYQSHENEIYTDASAKQTVADDRKNYATSISAVVKNEVCPHGAHAKKSADAIDGVVKNEIYTSTSIVTDPNGSYTGKPLNPSEVPVQDVDDL